MGIKAHKHILSAGEQYARMRILLPDFDCVTRSGKQLVAEGNVQPTALSVTYRVRIEYRGCKPPDVWVLSPPLVPREPGGRIPHMFRQERLCLYLPNTGQWSGDMVLAKVIVPWIALWLCYYEMWHATGEWLGGGHEPDEEKAPIRLEDVGEKPRANKRK